MTQKFEPPSLPVLSSEAHSWDNILLEQFQTPPGEGTCYYRNEHTIYLSLAPRPVRLMQVQDGKSYTALYGKGDMSLMPAAKSVFARWDGEDHHLQLRIATQFIQQVAQEALAMNPDRLEVLPEFRIRDPQLEAIAMLLLTELQQHNVGGKLYIDSLANVLAIHLIRQYATSQPRLVIHKGGLTERQVLQVLEYIHAHLHQAIKLADLAQLLGMSQFHFSHAFKQAIGKAPYQYLLQQRIERAKQLLKQTDQAIVDVAFICGFNSHSHLTKQFRQLTGMTPKAYRED
ncbi:MAG: AraC family transcriptional regulator [Leptolyngbyaceae cyanobacterium bins.302]|nr:AraC family transcriptional regulator [Leptolyngbyaceae cyanobacterium bins.302]